MALSAIKAAIESGIVVVISKGYCPFCRRAKVSYFNDLKFRHSEKAAKIWPSLLFLTSLSSVRLHICRRLAQISVAFSEYLNFKSKFYSS